MKNATDLAQRLNEQEIALVQMGAPLVNCCPKSTRKGFPVNIWTELQRIPRVCARENYIQRIDHNL